MQARQTSHRLPIHVLVQEEAKVWCTLGAKSGILGARLVQKGQGICPDLESSGRVDWIRTSDPLTPGQVRYQTAPPPVSASYCLRGLVSYHNFPVHARMNSNYFDLTHNVPHIAPIAIDRYSRLAKRIVSTPSSEDLPFCGPS